MAPGAAHDDDHDIFGILVQGDHRRIVTGIYPLGPVTLRTEHAAALDLPEGSASGIYNKLTDVALGPIILGDNARVLRAQKDQRLTAGSIQLGRSHVRHRVHDCS